VLCVRIKYVPLEADRKLQTEYEIAISNVQPFTKALLDSMWTQTKKDCTKAYKVLG
jgi:hypothetical protein